MPTPAVMPSTIPRNRLLNFDIDLFLNPFIPPSQVHRLPTPIAHFLGHRAYTPTEPSPIVAWGLTFFASVAGLCLVGGVFKYAPGIAKWNPPPLVASFGASAVLDYNCIRSPLAQPRNTIFGHTMSAIVAVAISKGFQRYAAFSSIDWFAAAIACGTANLLMSMTNTVHPPGGATAILACVQADVVAMGWMFVPVVMVGSMLMIIVACLFNNTLRWYPMYWWTSAEVGQAYKSNRKKQWEAEEKVRSEANEDFEQGASEERSDSQDMTDGLGVTVGTGNEIRVAAEGIHMPSTFELTHIEREFLGELQERLKLAVKGD